jgi:hypothetical protein
MAKNMLKIAAIFHELTRFSPKTGVRTQDTPIWGWKSFVSDKPTID